MAAYAALVSLLHTIDQIQLHPCPPIALDKSQVESLTKKLTFLQEFLEGYSHVGDSKEADALDMRIADAAYAAEDMIESQILDRILAGSTCHGVKFQHFLEEMEHDPFVDKEEVEYLKEKVSFLRGFVEGYSHGGDSKEADDLGSRIEDAAVYVLNSSIFNQIEDFQMRFSFARLIAEAMEAKTQWEKNTSKPANLYQGLQEVVGNMDCIKKEVTEIKEKSEIQDHLHGDLTHADSLRSSFTTRQSIMVGLDDVLDEVVDMLTGQPSNLQIIPIVGMGGIGKTTLAKAIYVNLIVEQHFDICAWTTISQEYSVPKILREVLCQVNKEGKADLSETSEEELGEILYKQLSGRRYLIVMDDLWSMEAWDKIKFFFPNYNNGSRLVTTTRLSNLALKLTNSYRLQMKFLDEDKSWNLLCKTVFGEEGCTLELEKIGKEIAKSCKGLPLSIIAIGGILAKSKCTRGYWEYILENLYSVINLEDTECCTKILHMSYSQLPIYLKPCFLYLGVFPEDKMIRVSMLIKLWVAEGFLKPISSKSLEEVAQEYLDDLIDRNLILVSKLGSTGKIKYCSVHDLFRDLCIREAEKRKFYKVMRQDGTEISQPMNNGRRIVILDSFSEYEILNVFECLSPARSLISKSKGYLGVFCSRLLRIMMKIDETYFDDNDFQEYFFQQVNLRCIILIDFSGKEFPSSMNLIWNLQTLIIAANDIVNAPVEIWNMPQLRHVMVEEALHLPNPPSCNVDGEDNIVLENLQMLKRIINFRCSKEIVKRIPNITKLEIYIDDEGGLGSDYCLNNFGLLHKLESFDCYYMPKGELCANDFLQDLTFPPSLKKLTLGIHDNVHWEEILKKIGSLPLLEKLKLIGGSFKRHHWETIEGQFHSLKSLRIQGCYDLELWTTDNTHFPRLENLVLKELPKLEEIPSSIGDISTLQSIKLKSCSDSAVISAERILEEQEELGNVGLKFKF